MRLARQLSSAEEKALVSYMQDVPWFDRDRHSLSAAVYVTCGGSRSARIMQAFDSFYRDVKQEDALSVVSQLRYRVPIERSRNSARVGVRSRALRRA
jgi:hypothetical protein